MPFSICVLSDNRRGYLEKFIQPIKNSKFLEIVHVEFVVRNRQLEIEKEIVPTKIVHRTLIEKLEL